MRNAVRYTIVLLAVASLATAAACAPAPTAAPTSVPAVESTSAPVPAPTNTEAAPPPTAAAPSPTAAAAPTNTRRPLPTYEPPSGAPTATLDAYIEYILLPDSTPQPGSAPASPEEVARISIDELKALLDSNARVIPVDTRPKGSYDMGHIKGAISFPWKPKLTMEDAALLPTDAMLVTYCSCGPGEADSASVAFQLIGFGLTNVKVLADPSVDGWIAAGYPSE